MARKDKQQALITAAATYLEELDDGDLDDAQEAVQEIDEYLAAIDDEHAEIREALASARAELLGEKKPPRKAKATAPKKAAAAKPAAGVKPAPGSRKVKPGTKFKTHADRIGGEPPFELTYTDAGEWRRIATLRAHMRVFFRVAKRELLADVAAIYDELLAASGPFPFLMKTTSRLYGAATPSTIAGARTRFECPAASSCYIAFKASELADDVAERQLSFAIHPRGSSAFSGCPSVIQLTLAPSGMDRAFRDRFVDLCARLPGFLCGTAGYYLDTTSLSAPTAKRVMDVALAHRGVELPGEALSAQFVGANWICGVNWLTALGAGARKTLGAELQRAPFEMHPAGDAVVIEAGPRPELGEGGVPPAAYARVHAQVCRGSALVGMPLDLRDDRVNAWHRRHEQP